MLKAIILCELYNLSDEQVEYQVRDRLSFMRFLGLGLEDPVPDARTIWLDREQLAQAGEVKPLFSAFDDHLKGRGYLAMGGQFIDASTVPVPRQRNKREENATIKAGDTPEAWKEKPARLRRKDCDARWTRKNGQSHYGDKNHINVDRRHKLVRDHDVSDAAVHDRQVLDQILDDDNTASDVWADSADRSAEIEEKLKDKGAEEPDPPQGQAQQAAERPREEGQQDPLQGARPGRACLWRPEQRHGRTADPIHRSGPGKGTDRSP